MSSVSNECIPLPILVIIVIIHLIQIIVSVARRTNYKNIIQIMIKLSTRAPIIPRCCYMYFSKVLHNEIWYYDSRIDQYSFISLLLQRVPYLLNAHWISLTFSVAVVKWYYILLFEFRYNNNNERLAM